MFGGKNRILFCLSLAFAVCMGAPAHAQKTKAQLNIEVGTTFPDQMIGAITPSGVRAFQSDVINSIMPTAPVTAGNLACFDGTTGLLKDCAIAPNILTIGGTVISGGANKGILYSNSALIGNTNSVANAVLATDGSADPLLTSTPSLGIPGVTAGAIALANLTSGTVTLQPESGALGSAVASLPAGTYTVVGDSLSQTLTGKTINGASNTLTVRIANDVTGLGTGIATALSANVGSAGAPVLLNGAGGTPSSLSLANATGLPVAGISGLGTGVAAALGNSLSAAGGVTSTIASGTSALGTSAIASATCATVVTVTATNTATTDVVMASFNSDPTAVTGYIPSTAGMLTIFAYPTANNVNFKICNNTLASITPGAVTLNWRVVR